MGSSNWNVHTVSGLEVEGRSGFLERLVKSKVPVTDRETCLDLFFGNDGSGKHMHGLLPANLQQEIVFLIEMKGRHGPWRRHKDESAPPLHARSHRFRVPHDFIETLVQKSPIFGVALHKFQNHPRSAGFDT